MESQSIGVAVAISVFSDHVNNCNILVVLKDPLRIQMVSFRVSKFSFNGFKPVTVTDCKFTIVTKLTASIRVSSILSSKYGHFWF